MTHKRDPGQPIRYVVHTRVVLSSGQQVPCKTGAEIIDRYWATLRCKLGNISVNTGSAGSAARRHLHDLRSARAPVALLVYGNVLFQSLGSYCEHATSGDEERIISKMMEFHVVWSFYENPDEAESGEKEQKHKATGTGKGKGEGKERKRTIREKGRRGGRSIAQWKEERR